MTRDEEIRLEVMKLALTAVVKDGYGMNEEKFKKILREIEAYIRNGLSG